MRLIALVTALLLSQAFAWADEAPQHVQARLIANVSAVEAGKPFMLGVELTIDPGWHVYWKNPGDSGLPTRVKIAVPYGFTVGELMYPAPARLPQAGAIINFGYENKVLLMAQVMPSDHSELADGRELKFLASVSWLVCQDECVPGKAKLELTLQSAAKADSANGELFEQWQKQLPVALADSADVARFDLDSTQHLITISWKNDGVMNSQLVYGASDDFEIKDLKISEAGKTTTIVYTPRALAGKSPSPTTIEAVVAYKNQNGEQRGLVFNLPLSAEVTK